MKPSEVFLLILLIIFFFTILPFVGAYNIIVTGYVGIVTRFGTVNRVVQPGLSFKIPIIELVDTMEIRTQKEQKEATAASKDLQEVKSVIALNYHLKGEKAAEVYQNVGKNYKEKVVDPAVQEAFKATTAQFTAEELITKRESVKEIVLKELKSRLAKYNIVVDDLNIVDFDFSADFNRAIEQKQVAQQNLEKAKLEAETARTVAKGQSDAQKILKDAGSLTPEYLQFKAIEKWNGALPLVTSGNPFFAIPQK